MTTFSKIKEPHGAALKRQHFIAKWPKTYDLSNFKSGILSKCL